MHLIMTIGLIALMMFSCKAPNVKDPVGSCMINVKKNIAVCGERNLNYKLERKSVGEWVNRPLAYDLIEAQNMVCFDLQDWLERIKPTLKETADFYQDSID